MRLRLALTMAVGGVGLMLAAANAPSRSGADTTLQIELGSDFSIDPAFAYDTQSWQLEYATCEKLFDYPDAEGAAGTRLVPEASDGWPRISPDGQTYTFRIRRGIRSNLGHELTAANFARAIERTYGIFSVDGTVGAQIGVTAHGQTLTVWLTEPRPALPAILSMPFFCAVPTRLPANLDETPIESWGPYYVAARTRGQSLTLARNTNYRGPRLHRPQRIVYTVRADTVGASEVTDIEHGRADYTPDELPAEAYADLAARYGVDHGRFFVRPTMTADYLFFNQESGIFAGNPRLRQAVNYALDRPALLRTQGFMAGRRATHYLSPGMPGYRSQDVYPRRGADFATARKQAAGHTEDGKAVIACGRSCWPILPVLRYDLKQIGIDLETTTPRGWMGGPIRNADINLEAWVADFADPSGVLNVLLDGPLPFNATFANEPPYAQRLREAARQTGPRRYETYGELDLDIARSAAPLAALWYRNARIFISARVKSFVYQPVYGLDLGSVVLR